MLDPQSVVTEAEQVASRHEQRQAVGELRRPLLHEIVDAWPAEHLGLLIYAAADAQERMRALQAADERGEKHADA